MPPKKEVKTPKYDLGASVLCKHLGTIYEAKILDIKDPDSSDPTYVIHYQGWNSRYDEQVKRSESVGKIFEATPEARAEAKRQLALAQSSSKKRKTRVENVNDDEFHRSENGSRGSSPASSVKGAKALKRKAGDSPAVAAPEKPTIEVNITLPKALRQILLDDSDLMDKNYLNQVPARFSVDDIISDYRESIGTKGEELKNSDELFVEYDDGVSSQLSGVSLVCSVLGLTDYFNVLLSQKLLYKSERPQYEDLVEKEKVVEKPVAKKRKSTAAAAAKEPSPPAATGLNDDDFRPSKYYGFVHLLRLIGKLPSVFKLSPWNDQALKSSTQAVHDFVVFLNKNYEKYFNSSLDYHVAPTDYYRLTHQP